MQASDWQCLRAVVAGASLLPPLATVRFGGGAGHDVAFAGHAAKEVTDWRTLHEGERPTSDHDMRRTIEGPPDCRSQRRHRSSDGNGKQQD